MKKFFWIVSLIFILLIVIISIDLILVFKYGNVPFLSINNNIDNGTIYYSLGYKVLKCNNGINQKKLLWQQGNCDEIGSASKFSIEIYKTDACIENDKIILHYDEATNMNYYVSCIDAIYVLDSQTHKKYTLNDVIEQNIIPINEFLELVNDQIPVLKEIKSTSPEFEIEILNNCDLNVKSIYNQDGNKIYTNCLNVQYGGEALNDALKNHRIDFVDIHEYIDYSSKYAEAIKDVDRKGRFIYKNLLYSIVACDESTLFYTPLDNYDSYEACNMIK